MIKNQLFSYTMDLLDRKDEILKRIYDRCKREGECLIWQQHADSHGYGQICVGNKERLVHRLVLILESGQEGECALHTPIICHNPRCCQIKHLRWGTKKEQAENRRSNKWYEVDGRNMIQKDWSRTLGVDNRLFNKWVKKKGFEIAYKRFKKTA